MTMMNAQKQAIATLQCPVLQEPQAAVTIWRPDYATSRHRGLAALRDSQTFHCGQQIGLTRAGTHNRQAVSATMPWQTVALNRRWAWPLLVKPAPGHTPAQEGLLQSSVSLPRERPLVSSAGTLKWHLSSDGTGLQSPSFLSPHCAQNCETGLAKPFVAPNQAYGTCSR